VIRIFNALLRLAEIDTGMRRSGFVQVNAAELAAEAVELYVPAAELKGISLSCRDMGPVPVMGDPLLLAQAVSNLIDNALKYARDGGRVSVEVQRRPEGAVEIAVADDGPGISAAEKLKAPERFYRGDTSRGTPGVGLGLSLVAAVAKLHGGQLVLADNHPGLRAQMLVEPHAARPWREHSCAAALTAAPEVVDGADAPRAGSLAAVKSQPLSG
jgi:signal transduction histidine kinase